MLKIYEDIINEVISKLEQAEDETNLGKSAIHELRNEWRERLIEYTQGEWGVERNINNDGQGYRGYERPPEESGSGFNGSTMIEREDGMFEDYESLSASSGDSEIIGKKGNVGNCMVCLYVKVNMSKGKWKCTFKQGFISIGNIDFVFNSAQGELEW
ncbi:transcription initiation factor IIA large chain [Encephalitozoon hellem ATCC 50504]|uniref:Transcription initiation factor IIA large chain n=1 Tax=Encephalitozoon hellem TaxID=27973 RepID=A0A9Q9CBH5_ENCHE|nr:transcription initiation factor IIA large chain [Encephalitozoon hellem ATCC 50504]AFM97994.1 transcription initiation factor IIA large chain [Encephalitozoon hellem ATCC 50504]UTX42798.1 transcription initiation factor IIA large chain [Encephalitozoon hellem]|eukprot:XP_003886975.1 transcription initiation factor IIA large chain [Encephalitozoon hellem ATCC 50504]